MTDFTRWRMFVGSAALAAILLAASGSPPARAVESYKALEPLLVDLPGWQGETPQGTSIDSGGQTMIQVTRRYTKNDGELTVLVNYGSKMTSTALGSNANIDTDDMRMAVDQIDGYKMFITFAKKDKTGSIAVALTPHAMLNIQFAKLGYEDAVEIARRFDLKELASKLAD